MKKSISIISASVIVAFTITLICAANNQTYNAAYILSKKSAATWNPAPSCSWKDAETRYEYEGGKLTKNSSGTETFWIYLHSNSEISPPSQVPPSSATYYKSVSLDHDDAPYNLVVSHTANVNDSMDGTYASVECSVTQGEGGN